MTIFKSRKFWAAVAGVVAVVVEAVFPNFPLTGDQIGSIILVLAAYILGTALEDGAKAIRMSK